MAKSSIQQREHFDGDESGAVVAEVPEVADQGFLGSGLTFTPPALRQWSVNLDRLKLLIVEAFSPEEAFGIYMKAMGILSTVHQPQIHAVTDKGVKSDVPYKKS